MPEVILYKNGKGFVLQLKSPEIINKAFGFLEMRFNTNSFNKQ
jgi:hypothetical protein